MIKKLYNFIIKTMKELGNVRMYIIDKLHKYLGYFTLKQLNEKTATVINVYCVYVIF